MQVATLPNTTHSMKNLSFKLIALITALVAVSSIAAAMAEQVAPLKASVVNGQSQQVGELTAVQTPNGVLIRLDLQSKPPGIEPGTHAIHIHAVGQCVPPFTSAGDHFNPLNRKHGFLQEQGDHVGDLPNIHVPVNGPLTVEFLIPENTATTGEITTLLDNDGFAVVIHQRADDYKTDPSGNSGDRIACAAVRPTAAAK
jgi:superoxide dismutase, Cu-Zn family